MGSFFRCQLYEHGKITGTKEDTSLDFEVCWPIDVHDVACIDLAVPQNVNDKSSGLAKLELREEFMVAPIHKFGTSPYSGHDLSRDLKHTFPFLRAGVFSLRDRRD